PGKLIDAGRYRFAGRAARYVTDSWVMRAGGEEQVEEVEVSVRGTARTLPCDLLCTGFGLVPNLELPRLLGCALEGGVVAVDEDQRTSLPGVWCAGEGTGVAGVEAALAEGLIAGFCAADAPERAAAHR